MKNLIFIGGIHGVGKGTFCKEISNQTDFIHLSCSDLIKWTEISTVRNKKVENIGETQQRLLLGLDNAMKDNENYILDGHFCLLNKENLPINVPLDTFEIINPNGIIVLYEDINVVYERLSNRDNLSYSFDLLKEFQKREITRAKEVAKKLNIKLLICKDNLNDAINFIINLK